MSMTQEDAKLAERLNKSFLRGRNPSVKLLGGKIESYVRDTKTITMTFVCDASTNNGNGQVMGGFLAAMMDVTVAQAAVMYSSLKQTVSTLEQKTSLLAPVRLGKGPDAEPPVLTCEAVAIKSGRTVAFYEVSLTDAKNKLVARATQTTLLIDIKPPPQKKVVPPAKL